MVPSWEDPGFSIVHLGQFRPRVENNQRNLSLRVFPTGRSCDKEPRAEAGATQRGGNKASKPERRLKRKSKKPDEGRGILAGGDCRGWWR